MRAAAVFNQQVRTLEQRLVSGPDDHMIRLAAFRRIHRHPRLGELAETDAEVEIGARIIGVPAALLAVIALKHEPAEVEAGAERRRGWKSRRGVAVAAAPHLCLGVDEGSAEDERDR